MNKFSSVFINIIVNYKNVNLKIKLVYRIY